MPTTVFLVVLFAAALHASWNAIVKSAGDKYLTTTLVAGSAAAIGAIMLPLLRPPDSASWPFIAASVLLQVVYFALVARTYHAVDMSLAYPLMRGVAPLLVALVSATAGAPLTPAMWLGVGIIGVGILSMAGAGQRGSGRGVILALSNAVVIASYTVVDGTGVRRSGAPAAYTLWIFFASGVPLVAWAVATRRNAVVAYARRHWHLGVIGGSGVVVSYGLALWAMTLAPVAVVAALRETSILFGTIISGLVLRERIGYRRIVAACAITLGAAVIRLA